MTGQNLPLAGVGNARQLGGYRIADRHVKDGVLLRTADLNHITPEALEMLRKKYHIQTVIDLRMSTERNRLPDPEIPGAKNLHLPVLDMEDMLEGADPELAERFMDPGRDRMKLFDRIYEEGFLSDQLYVNFLLAERGKRAYRAFFKALLQLDEGRAILWHCADGKDRTGCAAMLTLFALGASRETVMEDYLLTNACNARLLEGIRQRVAPLGFPPAKLDALLFLSGAVSEAYMDNAINALSREYGSVQGYLAEVLDVGKQETELLRHKFLD